MLINGGKPSPKLRNTFIEIFNLYSQHEERIEQELSLIPTMASRLWYRCGLKLSKLNDLLKTKDKPFLSFLDFIGLIEQVLEEDEARMSFSSLPLDEALPVSVVEVRHYGKHNLASPQYFLNDTFRHRLAIKWNLQMALKNTATPLVDRFKLVIEA